MEALAIEQLQGLERDHWWFRGRRAVYIGLLRHHLGGERPRRVLDLGCGTGGFAASLGEVSGEVVGADFDTACLRVARARGMPGAVQVSGERLPFAAASFDIVCLFDVLEHIDDDCATLREVRRVLRPGGRMIASVPAYPVLYAENDRIARHRRRYTRRSLADVVARAGLELERNTHANTLLFPLILPAVLASKLWERLTSRLRRRRGDAPGHTNLSWRLPRPLGELCYRAFAAELPLARRFDLPVGHSIAVIARPSAPPATQPSTSAVSGSGSRSRSMPGVCRPYR